MIGSIEIKEQTFADVTFMNIKCEPRISSKANVAFDMPKVPIRGLPITLDFLENDLSFSFDAVSAKYEVPSEAGALNFSKMQILV